MEHTAKNFVIQLGSLIALYVSLSAVVSVAFGIINLMFPDAAGGVYQYDSAQNGIRFGFAMLVVFFPTYIILTRVINQTRRRSEGKYLVLTRWLIYLSLLAGGAILLGDLVAVIWTYLSGEITMRFILKALVLLVVIGAAFKYYILDARGYWNTHEDQSKLFGAGTVVLVVATVVLGFFNADSPATVRAMKLDDQQVTDLQDIQYRIEDYYRLNGALPITLADAYVKGVDVPAAPEGREAYTYTLNSSSSFSLCATFASPSKDTPRPYTPVGGDVIKNPYNWDHGEGATCFERVVNQ